jgi:hypothetical protein
MKYPMNGNIIHIINDVEHISVFAVALPVVTKKPRLTAISNPRP